MNRVKLPDYFTTLKKGKVTLFIHKKYEKRLTEQDLNRIFCLYRDDNVRSPQIQSRKSSNGALDHETKDSEPTASYHGRTPCKSIFLKSLNQGSLVVRDYWHGGLFGMILRDIFCQGLRPIRELIICESASKKGIRTIEIVAILKNKVLGPLFKSKLISREIENSTDLMEMFLKCDQNSFLTRKREIIAKVAHAIKEMHDAGIYHADLNLKNILLQTVNDSELVAYIIDLDKSKQYDELKPKIRMKNLMRLDRSWEKFKRKVSLENCFQMPCTRYITKGDKFRFMKEYLSSGRIITPVVKMRCHGEEAARHDIDTDTDSLRNQEKLLKTLLKSYLSSHQSHRFCWWLIELFGKR